MRVAVLGATGTAGRRTVSRLRELDVEVVEVSRSGGVDLISGTGLAEALRDVDVGVDTSQVFPPDGSMSLHEAMTSATRNVVDAARRQRVWRLVVLSIAGIEHPALDGFPYYAAKRAQERIVAESPVESSILKSTQWHEFATNPSVVTFANEYVEVEDWLIQPVAADTVADALARLALNPDSPATRTITGPEMIRLPDLTRRLMERLGDPRPVRPSDPALPALAEGVLLATADAEVVGPDIEGWLEGLRH